MKLIPIRCQAAAGINYITIPTNASATSIAPMQNLEAGLASEQRLSFLSSSSNNIPFQSANNYSVPGTSMGGNITVDGGMHSFNNTTANYPNIGAFRPSQSFAPQVISVPPNHISPTASDGQRSTSSQPMHHPLRSQSISEDALMRNVPPNEREKSPHVFTSVRQFHIIATCLKLKHK